MHGRTAARASLLDVLPTCLTFLASHSLRPSLLSLVLPAEAEEASGASEVKAAGPALVEEASMASEVKDDLTVDPDPSIRRGTNKRLRLMMVDEI